MSAPRLCCGELTTDPRCVFCGNDFSVATCVICEDGIFPGEQTVELANRECAHADCYHAAMNEAANAHQAAVDAITFGQGL